MREFYKPIFWNIAWLGAYLVDAASRELSSRFESHKIKWFIMDASRDIISRIDDAKRKVSPSRHASEVYVSILSGEGVRNGAPSFALDLDWETREMFEEMARDIESMHAAARESGVMTAVDDIMGTAPEDSAGGEESSLDGAGGDSYFVEPSSEEWP